MYIFLNIYAYIFKNKKKLKNHFSIKTLNVHWQKRWSCDIRLLFKISKLLFHFVYTYSQITFSNQINNHMGKCITTNGRWTCVHSIPIDSLLCPTLGYIDLSLSSGQFIYIKNYLYWKGEKISHSAHIQKCKNDLHYHKLMLLAWRELPKLFIMQLVCNTRVTWLTFR